MICGPKLENKKADLVSFFGIKIESAKVKSPLKVNEFIYFGLPFLVTKC